MTGRYSSENERAPIFHRFGSCPIAMSSGSTSSTTASHPRRNHSGTPASSPATYSQMTLPGTNGPNQISTIADRSGDSDPSRLIVRNPCPTLSSTRRRSSVRFFTIFSRPMTLSKKLRATKQAATDSSTTNAACTATAQIDAR